MTIKRDEFGVVHITTGLIGLLFTAAVTAITVAVSFGSLFAEIRSTKDAITHLDATVQAVMQEENQQDIKIAVIEADHARFFSKSG